MIKNRIYYLDIARTIAIISITCNHALFGSFAISSGQFIEFNKIPIILSIIKIVLYAFSRIGVPLFLMISGALLLPRNYEENRTIKFLKNNWLRLVIITELWLTIMFWYKQIGSMSVLQTQGIGICLIRFFMTLLFINPITMGNMWYMPMILCVYLIIPILSLGLKKINNKYFLFPIAIVTFCSFILPDVNRLLNALFIDNTLKTSLVSENVFSMYVVMLLIGYFSNEGLFSKISNIVIILLFIITFISFCIFQLWLFSHNYKFNIMIRYDSILLILISMSLFEILHRIKEPHKTIWIKLCTEISKISFGIYFIHMIIISITSKLLNYYNIQIFYLCKFLVLELVAFGGSILIIKILGKNKWISKNLFGIKE